MVSWAVFKSTFDQRKTNRKAWPESKLSSELSESILFFKSKYEVTLSGKQKSKLVQMADIQWRSQGMAECGSRHNILNNSCKIPLEFMN